MNVSEYDITTVTHASMLFGSKIVSGAIVLNMWMSTLSWGSTDIDRGYRVVGYGRDVPGQKYELAGYLDSSHEA